MYQTRFNMTFELTHFNDYIYSFLKLEDQNILKVKIKTNY